jgi:hypothetical protein
MNQNSPTISDQTDAAAYNWNPAAVHQEVMNYSSGLIVLYRTPLPLLARFFLYLRISSTGVYLNP